MTFHWDKIDLRLGFWFAVVTFAVFNLAEFVEAAWMAAGLSALLAWLPILLLDYRNLRNGALSFAIILVLGIVLSVLGHWVNPSEPARILAMGAVAFAAGLILRLGVFWYLVAYVLVFWYTLSPLFSGPLGLADAIEGHVVGVTALAAFWIIRQIRVNGASWRDPAPDPVMVPAPTILPFASILAGTMMAGIGIGGRVLSADPTLMAQASLNIIAPSVRQTWEGGLVRASFGLVGLLIGFYAGLFFPGLIGFEIVIATSAFVALAFLKVHLGFLVGAFAAMFSYPIGAQGPELGHAIGNERLLAEAAGILLAVIAISLLIRIQKAGAE